jgi:hypothetical protein
VVCGRDGVFGDGGVEALPRTLFKSGEQRASVRRVDGIISIL